MPPLTTRSGPLLLATISVGAVALWSATRPDRARAVLAERSTPVATPVTEADDTDSAFPNDLVEQVLAPAGSTPLRTSLERPTSSSSTKSAARRDAARPGTERWHRERFDELARGDARQFEELARARLDAADTLAEQVALLLVAQRRDADLADELWSRALDVKRPDGGVLRSAAVQLLERAAPRSPSACRRLWISVVLERGLDAPLRSGAARIAAAVADELLLSTAASTLRDEPAAAVRSALLHGLKQNVSTAATELATELTAASPWREDALEHEQSLDVRESTIGSEE